MNRHGDYIEMISAYADNELTAAVKSEVEKHLSACDECSALLALYREISSAADESAGPAPDILRANIMNNVRKSDINIAASAYKPKRKYPLRILATRLMPAAACLVVALLAWRYFGDMFRTNEAAYDTAPAMPGNMSSVLQADADNEYYPGQSGNYTVDSFDESITGSGGGYADDPAAEPYPASAPQLSADKGMADIAMGADDASEILKEAIRNKALRGNDEKLEEEFIKNYLDNASYWITITGELPAVLNTYKPEDIEPVLGWEQVYIIPGDDVPKVLTQLDEHNAKFTAANNTLNVFANSVSVSNANAVILYSPE